MFKSKYVINSDKLKSTRERAKLSLEDAASSCSLSSQQINSLENGLDVGFFNAHFKEIAAKKYIKYLGLSQSDILMHEEASPSEEVEPSEQTLTLQTHFHRLIRIAITNKKTTIISVLAVTLLLMLALKDPIENEHSPSPQENEIPADAFISDNQTDVSLSEEPIRINEHDDHSHSSPSPIIAKTDEVPVNNSNDCTNLLNTDNFQNYEDRGNQFKSLVVEMFKWN